ncbi:hypothetical protein [Micrococcus sp.]|uniref:hypothetical protein n=1 Tax=Micrococcus sp. TaxID=1271 RepID=UPI0026DD9F3E|nr:hypothetical protein [Micrococcus sp.]MDO4239109.1 hypothetical protein [Micrococcus sp.]
MFDRISITVLSALAAVLHDDVRDDRGDVPGWVMITLMSAVLVAGLLALALPALQEMFNSAIARVNGAG